MFNRIFITLILTVCIVENALAQQTGAFIKKLTPFDILGVEAEKYDNYIKQDTLITWEIYVPKEYDASNPPGIYVFAGAPRVYGEVSGNVLDDKNLIWVVGRKSGVVNSIYQKVLLAKMSVSLIKNEYSVDDSRIYITGEGRTAVRTILDNPEMFSGGFLVGDNIWQNNAAEKIKNVLNKRFVFADKIGGNYFDRPLNESNLSRNARRACQKFKNAGVVGAICLPRQSRYLSPFMKSILTYLDEGVIPTSLKAK